MPHAGTASTTVNVPNGQTFVTYYVHGLENVTGSATVTVSAPGFTGASHPVEVVPIGIEILGLDSAQTNLSANDSDWYRAGWNSLRGQRAVVSVSRTSAQAGLRSSSRLPTPTAMSRVWPRISRLPSVRS